MSANIGLKRSIAIIGIGEVGKALADSFLANDHVVTIITRQGSTNKHLSALGKRGAQVKEVDYKSLDSIKKAISGVDVVISTLSGAAFSYQYSIAKAAKEVGTEIFVPSMWGFDYTKPRFQDPARTPPSIIEKYSLLKRLDEIDISWMAFSNGLFTSWMFSIEHGINAKKREVHWQGNGDQLLTFSHLEDVAAFVRKVLSGPSLAKDGCGRWYYIESFRASFNQIFEEAQRIDGEQWSIHHSGIEKAVEMQTQDTADGENAWHLSLIHDGDGLRRVNDNEQVGFTPSHAFQDSVREALEISRA